MWQLRRGMVAGRAALDAGSAYSAEVSQYLSRATGMDSTHINAFVALIDGLVADSVWTKLDALYVFATDTQAHALLNVKSSSYSCTANGSPTFTADAGFTGTSLSTTVYLDTGFNPSTAGGNFAQNSAHISVWGNNTPANANEAYAGLTTGGGVYAELLPKWGDGLTYASMNDGLTSITINPGLATGLQTMNRSGASAGEYYRGASSAATTSQASSALLNGNVYILARNSSGSAANGTAQQLSCSTIGSSLSATDVSNLNSRLGTYRTAVGL